MFKNSKQYFFWNFINCWNAFSYQYQFIYLRFITQSYLSQKLCRKKTNEHKWKTSRMRSMKWFWLFILDEYWKNIIILADFTFSTFNIEVEFSSTVLIQQVLPPNSLWAIIEHLILPQLFIQKKWLIRAFRIAPIGSIRVGVYIQSFFT